MGVVHIKNIPAPHPAKFHKNPPVFGSIGFFLLVSARKNLKKIILPVPVIPGRDSDSPVSLKNDELRRPQLWTGAAIPAGG